MSPCPRAALISSMTEQEVLTEQQIATLGVQSKQIVIQVHVILRVRRLDILCMHKRSSNVPAYRSRIVHVKDERGVWRQPQRCVREPSEQQAGLGNRVGSWLGWK